MKKTLAFILALCLCVGLCACDSSEYNEAMDLFNSGNYESALLIFESLGDYKNSKTFAQKCNYNLAMKSFEQGDYEDAISIFVELGEFEDSAEYVNECNYYIGTEKYNAGDYSGALTYFEKLGTYNDSADYVEKIGYKTKYNEAVSLFTNGKFSEAIGIFESLPIEFEDVGKYILAIDYLEDVVGVWSEDSYTADNSRGDVVMVVDLSIAAPFSIKKSEFSDCDWGVFANVKLDVLQIWRGSAMTSSGGKQANFTLTGGEVASHLKDAKADDLETSFLITNTNAYHTVHDSRYGAYSKIWFELTTKSGKPCIRLTETPYSIDWSTQYGDGGVLYLFK